MSSDMASANSEARVPSSWAADHPFVTVRELCDAGRDNLAQEALNFLEGGAGDELTIADNRRAFERWHFRPRHVVPIETIDTRTTILGVDASVPFFTAPFGLDHAFNPDGMLAVARAHAALGVPLCVSRASSFSLEAIAEAAGPGPRLFQMLPVGRAETFLALAQRAKAAGYSGLIITVDAATVGWRERSREDRWRPPTSQGWGNYRRPDGSLDQALLDELENERRPGWAWDGIGRLCREAGLPWMPKGVLIPEEARAAVQAGADGIYVSNHGGRELDRIPAALDALVPIVEAVGSTVPVVMDGGVRRGSDVAAALSLGATAAGWGRPTALALAADGEDGVRRLLELVRQELITTMTLLGRHAVQDLDPSCVQRAGSST